MLKRILFFLFGFIIMLIIVFAAFISYLSLNSYHPEKIEVLYAKKNNQISFSGKEITILTWNIGYGGLGKDMDFFYEGGKRTRPAKKELSGYLSGIINEIRKHDSVDFIFLQEIDRNSKRSYFEDEFLKVTEAMPGHNSYFAKNYDSKFVPVPLTEPMGKVISGIAVLARHNPDSVTRVDFGTKFSWPKQLVMLQRCYIMLRFELENGKDLVLINTHNSVFDKDGQLRKLEMKILKETFEFEFSKGNYVIAGGDWNTKPEQDGDIWKAVFDSDTPTNREVNMPYKKNVTHTSIIDYFVVSPNIEVLEVKARELDFEFSDHNPVMMKIKLL